MAEHMIETRILLRYDTFDNWTNSNTILLQGEAAICAFPSSRVINQLSNITPINTPPAIGIKIGDGAHYFRELPWVQAIAADVYNWAKTSTKPSYTATEISGLQSFIEENFHIGGDITIAPRIYQIVQGTGVNSHKYYLRYKENNEDSEWITDTNHAIDLTIYNDIYDWIGQSSIDTYMTLADFIIALIIRRINNLNYTDNDETHKFVTSVSQNSGIINVNKAQPTFSDIAGLLPVEQGGTGVNTIPLGEVLIGNGTNAITTIPIAESIANNDYLVTNRLVKSYVETATAGLTGAMHFIGEASVVITPNSSVNPQIPNYNFSQAKSGDVILYGSQEYVWDGGVWILLGDEGSYAIKGSIKDIDIDPEAEISQSKIAGLADILDTKIDKVEGKTLTSNDFTNELKEKLENMGTNAEVNVIEHILLNDNEILPTTINELPKSINLHIQEFTDDAQRKLNNIENYAQANTIERIIYNGEELTPDANKIITITPNPHTEHENKIESIVINGVEQIPDKNKQIKITIDDAALNLQVIKGARVPNSGVYEDVEITPEKKLELSRIAKTGNINDIIQTSYTYVTLDCGSSTEVL